MRWTGTICFSLVLLAAPAGAAAQETAGRWALHLGLARESFSGASSDTSSIPGTRVEVTPSPRLSFEVGVGRRFGKWELSVGTAYAPGGLRARTPDFTLDDRTGGVDRIRGVLRIGRELLRLDRAGVVVEGGVAIDRWSTDGLGSRTVAAGLGGVRLRVPLGGGVSLEQSALFAVGGSPFAKSALPPEATVSRLRTWSLGVGLRRGW